MTRVPSAQVDPLFVARWSGRSFTGEPLPDGALATLLEAARWAPSCNNSQPWRLIYALRDTPSFAALFDLLSPGNKTWCEKASALFVVVARTTFDDGRPSRTHAFDTGAAWMSLALQAHLSGLVAHGMAGFDYDRAPEVVAMPPDHAVMCMVAVGLPGPRDALPEPYRTREEPNNRHPASTFAFEGRFKT